MIKHIGLNGTLLRVDFMDVTMGGIPFVGPERTLRENQLFYVKSIQYDVIMNYITNDFAFTSSVT